jgi:hypothetical protein
MLCDGRLRTYDSSGSLTDEIATGLFNLTLVADDETTRRVAFGAWLGTGTLPTGAVIVDPTNRNVQVLPDIDLVANVTFAREGRFWPCSVSTAP